METVEKREAYLDWINTYCNQSYTEKNMPGGVKLALDKLIEMEKLPVGATGVRSESVSDLSRTFAGSADGELPAPVKKLLTTYRRARTVTRNG